MKSYTTVLKRSIFEYEDRKSVFIAEAAPVSNEADALSFIAEIKKKYPTAKHHVYAYVLRDNMITRFSDDREPQGTAGLPTLDAIRKNDCVDTVVVVARYFGGTLLGTGGLVRAYSASAVGAVKAAEIITYDTYTRFKMEFSYSDYQKVLPFLENSNFRCKNTEYSDAVFVSGSIKKQLSQDFEKMIIDIVGARGKITNDGESFEY